jgi:hypothetical protein
MLSIPLPQTLDAEGALEFVRELLVADHPPEIQIDFSALGHVSPFGMLVLADALQKVWLGRRPRLVGHEDKSYLAHMGFFKACGVEFGKAPGEARGSDSYLPMTILKLSEVRAQAKTEVVRPQIVIERLSKELAARLAQSSASAVYRVLQFGIQELLRNVVEHSEAEVVAFAAQYWASREKAEIAVLDGGIGIYSSLRKNRRIEPDDEAHALYLSLLPGVTSRSGTGAILSDEWTNIGFGLYMTSSIARANGHFIVASGRTVLTLRGNDKALTQCASMGTAVCMHLSTDNATLARTNLTDLSAEGDRIAKKLGYGPIARNAASRALRSD